MLFPLRLQKFTLQQKNISLFVPDELAVKERYQEGKVFFPYWAQVWPSAFALSNFLLLHPHYIQRKKVIEIGGGLGLPSITAAPLAASVICSDISAEAVAIVQQSAIHNRLHNLHTEVFDWNTLPTTLDAEVLLLSDVNYDPSLFVLQLEILNRFLHQNTLILLSTPQRLTGKELLNALLPFCQQKEEVPIVHNGEKVMISVFAFSKHRCHYDNLQAVHTCS